DADDARIFVDRAAHRGDVHVEVDDADPDAVDTWIGAGEGVKLFSDVFGAFLPAEESPPHLGPEHHQRAVAPRRASPRPHRDAAAHHLKKPARSSGFFARLFGTIESFAQRAVSVATQVTHPQQARSHAIETIGHAVAPVLDPLAIVTSVVLDKPREQQPALVGPLGDIMARTAPAPLPTKSPAKHVHAEAKREEKKHVLDEPRRLDALTLNRMETFLQGNFQGVRVHTGKGAEEITSRFGAEAVTVTDHVFFAPGKFNPNTLEGERLIAHELTHVLQKGRQNLDVRTAESEALRSEHTYGKPPPMETLDLRRPPPDFKLADYTDGEGAGLAHGVHTAKRTRSRGDDAGGKDEPADGDDFLEKVSGRVYELLMEELEESFESR
ncbi:MAG TPA: DUF4157 domain-containing protein, partial [Myxococcales bacterium]|nr:DUF4157 domain-containing protein [Myxococcales bacterium]